MSIEMNDEHEKAGEIRFLGDVQRLQLQPGDVVVLTVDRALKAEEFCAIQNYMDKRLPDHTTLVLESALRIGVLGKQGESHGKD